jgi:hypothetical protein
MVVEINNRKPVLNPPGMSLASGCNESITGTGSVRINSRDSLVPGFARFADTLPVYAFICRTVINEIDRNIISFISSQDQCIY